MLTAGICELTLDTRDMKAMEAFYCAVIGCEVLDREDDRVWLGCGDRSV